LMAVNCVTECRPTRVISLPTILTDMFISCFVSGRDIPCFVHF
jgi:hypothetical protein